MKNGLLSLTFDDGLISQYEEAVPILDRYKVKGTFYINTHNIESPQPGYFGSKEIIDLFKLGHEIGAHSVSHSNLFFSFPWKGWEVNVSKEHLSSLGVSPTSFAYPYGQHHRFVRRLVRKSGFGNARTADGNFYTSRGNQWAISGKLVLNSTSLNEVEEWLTIAKEFRLYLVLIFHQVEPNPPAFGCSPLMLDGILQLANTLGLDIVTVTEGWKKYSQIDLL